MIHIQAPRGRGTRYGAITMAVLSSMPHQRRPAGVGVIQRKWVKECYLGRPLRNRNSPALTGCYETPATILPSN